MYDCINKNKIYSNKKVKLIVNNLFKIRKNENIQFLNLFGIYFVIIFFFNILIFLKFKELGGFYSKIDLRILCRVFRGVS